MRLEFEELRLAGAPIELSGFEPDEIDQILICGDDNGIESHPLEPDAGAVATSQPGDLFQLGPHFILCGDATDPEVVARLMAGSDGSKVSAALIMADPPYNVRIVGNVTRGPHREFAMAAGEMTNEEFQAFTSNWIKAALPHLRDGGVLGCFIDWRNVWFVHAAARALQLTLLNLVVWAKSNAGIYIGASTSFSRCSSTAPRHTLTTFN